MTDKKAMAEFVKARSSEAFAVLARRYVDLVYSTARRLARDAHLAEDITQAVFIVLARRASSINPKYLAGWLVNTSRLAAREAIRTRNRQQNREAQAAHMRPEIQSDEEPTAEQISPLLDDAMARLNAADRSAVVMRFFAGEKFCGCWADSWPKRGSRPQACGTINRKNCELICAIRASPQASVGWPLRWRRIRRRRPRPCWRGK